MARYAEEVKGRPARELWRLVESPDRATRRRAASELTRRGLLHHEPARRRS